MDGRTAAATLGVEPGATRQQIRRAFRARARAAHPDGAGSADAFIALRAAFEVLLAAAPETEPSGPAEPPAPCGSSDPATTPDEPPVPHRPVAARFATAAPGPRHRRLDLVDIDVEVGGNRPVGGRRGPGGVARSRRPPSADQARRGMVFAAHLEAALAGVTPGTGTR